MNAPFSHARPVVVFSVAMLVTPLVSPAALGQVQTTLFEFAPGSTYSYLVGGFSPVPDCDGNDDRQCDFLIEGTFVLEEFAGGAAAITEANIELISPLPVDPLLPGQLVTGERVADYLESLTFESIPSIPESVFYQSTALAGQSDPLVIGYTLLPPDGTGELLGGYDDRPFDGDGVLFAATLRVVPEPGALVLGLLAAGLVVSRRRASSV